MVVAICFDNIRADQMAAMMHICLNYATNRPTDQHAHTNTRCPGNAPHTECEEEKKTSWKTMVCLQVQDTDRHVCLTLLLPPCWFNLSQQRLIKEAVVTQIALCVSGSGMYSICSRAETYLQA